MQNQTTDLIRRIEAGEISEALDIQDELNSIPVDELKDVALACVRRSREESLQREVGRISGALNRTIEEAERTVSYLDPNVLRVLRMFAGELDAALQASDSEKIANSVGGEVGGND